MNNKKNVNLRWYVALSPDMHDRVAAYAIATSRSIGKAVEYVLKQELERFEGENKL